MDSSLGVLLQHAVEQFLHCIGSASEIIMWCSDVDLDIYVPSNVLNSANFVYLIVIYWGSEILVGSG